MTDNQGRDAGVHLHLFSSDTSDDDIARAIRAQHDAPATPPAGNDL